MHLWISGFLDEDNEDDSLKYSLTVLPEFEKAVMGILGWQSLAAECDGELLLTPEQVRQISTAMNEQLPTELDLFIGVRG
ncbi:MULTISPECIES: pyocin S6 family toxin immunity protein [unclassified Pseudomonas]|uniref:pyocin S6 family toxin immunity protein n=1 Tax=unclassified Pseudomonas TaxID=196821 RepID=UPI0030DAFE8F